VTLVISAAFMRSYTMFLVALIETFGWSRGADHAGSDFAANARTLDRLGLAGKNAEQIKHVMQSGL
jgi:hypothetical protein